MVWLALVTVYIVWGSTYLAIAYLVQTVPPFLGAGVRFLIAGALLAAWIAVRDRGALQIDRRQLLGAAVVGILLLAGGNGLVMAGEQTVPSGLAALIVASVPLWIVLMRLGAGDRVRGDVVAGVVVGIVGVGVLVVPGGMSGTLDTAGLVMLVGATLAWATGTFLSPRLRMPRNALASTALQMLVAGVVLLVISAPLGEYASFAPAAVSTSSLVALVYLIAIGSLVGFSAYTWLLQHAPVSLVATYAYVNPVVAVVLGSLMLREPITPTMIGGAALILAAVAFIVSRSATRATPAAARASVAPTASRSPSARD
jgi:drug/metabolite transporter (DMT)-like permease